jgi:DNA modification methylase
VAGVKPYYSDDAVTIYHADCRELLPELSADLVLTDPPYGKKPIKTQTGSGFSANRFSNADVNWDVPPASGTIKAIQGVAPQWIIWGGNYFATALPNTNCVLVWDKMNGENPYADIELAWTNFTITSRIFRLQWIGASVPDKMEHPTQKSVALMRWCIGLAPNEPQIILDPFMGSGTTLRAAKDLNRKAIGIEIEERYCEIAAKRMAQTVMQL